ncbi:hypothetical protein VPH209E381_0073 [Vibrio phage 209E38-1]
MKNKKVRARFDGITIDCWCGFNWPSNDLVNGWMDYKEGDFDNGRYGQKYVSLTADQLRGK